MSDKKERDFLERAMRGDYRLPGSGIENHAHVTRTGEFCAIAAWRYQAGRIVHDVWIKKRGADAISLVQELIEMRFNGIKADTLDSGSFVIVEDEAPRYAREFWEWANGSKNYELRKVPR